MNKIIKKNIKKQMIIFWTTIYLCAACTGAAYGESNVKYKSLTIEDGLTQSTVEAIYQDSRGYMWLGTNEGLNRYNGYEIKAFKSDDEENPIEDDYILEIAEDKDGYLWVATKSGISKINLNDYSVQNYNDITGGIPSNSIDCMIITSKDDILVGTTKGVAIYDRELDSFKKYEPICGILKSNYIMEIEEDKYGGIWIAAKDGITVFKNPDGNIEYYAAHVSDSTESEVNALKSDSDGYMWVGTKGNGLKRININTGEEKIYTSIEDDDDSIPSSTIKKIFEDKKGNLWVGTSKGLAKLEKGREKFTIYKNKTYDYNSLINDYVYSIFEDESGIMWIGTYAGMSIFNPDSKIKHYKNDPFDENSLSNNVVHGIYEDKYGKIWIGTNGGGVNIYDDAEDTFKHIGYGEDEYGISDDNVKVITGSGDTVWIGTRNGINQVDTVSGKVKKIFSKDGISSDNIKSLLYDDRGYLWIGTPIGLDIMNIETGEIISLNNLLLENGFKDTYIEEIFKDSNGDFWIGSFLGSGIMQIDSSFNVLNIYSRELSRMDTDSTGNSVRNIAEDEMGNLWIATSKGLVKFDGKEEFTIFTTKEGLANNMVYGVLIDSDDNIWASTNNGISQLNVSTGEFYNMSSLDGIQSNEFNGKAYCKLRDGRLVFGGINGFNVFDPVEISGQEYLPEIEVEDFNVQGNNVGISDDMIFRSNENNIRISYFIPKYFTGKTIYEYRVEGLNEEWTSVTSNVIILNSLNPGKYRVDIRYKDEHGAYSFISSIPFKIKAPIWGSWYAIIFYIVFLIYIIYREKNKVKRLDEQIQKKTKMLKDEIEVNNNLFQQVLKLEKNKNNYFINLSHELRTPLNVIASVAQLIKHLNQKDEPISKEKLNHYMDVMDKNTRRLLKLINNIIDASKFDNGNYVINKKENNIVYVVEEAALSLKEYIEARGISLIIDTEVEEKIILCDAYEIEMCIVNLVSNAAKFTPAGGKIEVLMYDCGDKFKIAIADNGIGIDEKYHESIFNRFNQVVDPTAEQKGGSGLGLTITKHIVDLHNGEIYVESKKDEGSRFVIILPANSI